MRDTEEQHEEGHITPDWSPASNGHNIYAKQNMHEHMMMFEYDAATRSFSHLMGLEVRGKVESSNECVYLSLGEAKELEEMVVGEEILDLRYSSGSARLVLMVVGPRSPTFGE